MIDTLQNQAAAALCDRRQAELEARVIEEETARLVTASVEVKVKEVMSSQAVQQSLQERLVRERKLLEEQACHLPHTTAHRPPGSMFVACLQAGDLSVTGLWAGRLMRDAQPCQQINKKPAAEHLLANCCPHGGTACCMLTSFFSTSPIAAAVCTCHMSRILQHGQHDIRYACVAGTTDCCCLTVTALSVP